MKGDALMKEIRRLQRQDWIEHPVMIVANSANITEMTSRLQGPDQFDGELSKPFSRDDILKIVKDLNASGS